MESPSLMIAFVLLAGSLAGVLAWAIPRFLRKRMKTLREQIRAEVVAEWQWKLDVELTGQREIQRELAHLASFAEMAPHPIVETTPERAIRYANPAAQTEFPDLAKLGRAHPLLEDLELALQILKREGKSVLRRPVKVGPRVYDQQISCAEGSPGIRLHMTDITELKRLDQLKTDFVNTVSHELRTPMTTIFATVKLVDAGLHGPITPDQKEALDLALVNLDRLNRLINELLDISKIEAGKMELHRRAVNVADLVQELARTFEPVARQRKLELRTRTRSGPLEAYLDRDKISQVFTNLIQNAMKFTAQGHVEIGVEAEDHHLRCTVADSGPGIAEVDLPKVFSKFQQFRQKAATGERGTGLGLSLCRGLVELHEGRIWVESRPGEGSRFIFTLPVVRAEDHFRHRTGKLFEESVASAKPLSLFCFQIANASRVRERLGEKGYGALLERLEGLLKQSLRDETDTLVQAYGGICVALPSVDAADAERILERVEQGFRSFEFQQAIGLPVELSYRRVTYPRDGSLLEHLLATLLPLPL